MSISTVFVGGFGSTILLFELHIDSLEIKDSRLFYKETFQSESCPSFLETFDNKIYSVNEVDYFDGKKSGGLTYFEITDSGTLNKVQEHCSGGLSPCHLAYSHDKNCIYVANYASGHFAVFEVDKDGSLGSSLYNKYFDTGSGCNTERQASSHPHGVYIKDNYVYVVDLGADRIWCFNHENESLSLSPLCILAPSGSGPRHMVFHKIYSLAFVLTELSNEILVYSYASETGNLKLISSYPFISDASQNDNGDLEENFGSEILIHPNGEFLYISNRVHGAIISYKILDSEGSLKKIQHYFTAGTWPRHFAIHPSGKVILCADQFKDIVEVIAVNASTGMLEKIEIVECKNQPSCIVFKKC
ncbi:6-phosphogluconolactonase isoform X2 [Hydra vulgaris]|uniref:6-phosphogluconolactonase isoform X2 n=1 Tax=Hydra vulgaris TaxID=6087 RepID=A0ABM4DDJ5_HYDVU